MLEPHFAPSRVVGILGGMGPAATVDFYDKLVRHTRAAQDQDHLRVVIWADPTVPSRQDALLHQGDDPTPWLQEGVRRLISAGAEIVVTPCNTVHAYLGPVMIDQPVEFISIVDATTEAIQSRGVHCAGLLATDGALVSGLFQAALEAVGIEWITPTTSQQRRVMAVVEAVKSSRVDASHCDNLRDIVLELRDRGAQATLAGCTEISSLLSSVRLDEGVEVIDSALELALRTIQQARRSPDRERRDSRRSPRGRPRGGHQSSGPAR